MTLQVERDFELQPFNTLRVQAKAAECVQLTCMQDCTELAELCHGKPVLILGGGSNIVLVGDFPGLVIFNRLLGIDYVAQSETDVVVRVAGGECWDDFVAYSLQQGWYGLENLSAIPGTVGAAPVQNIGAYGVELCDVVESVDVVLLADGQVKTFARAECQFGYRDSIFKQALKDQCLITHVTFRLQRHPHLKLEYGEIKSAMQTAGVTAETITAQQLRDIITEVRWRKLPNPAQWPNVGSFFKNPVIRKDRLVELQQRWPDLVNYPVDVQHVKIAAGWLLDRLGWKGQQRGAAKVHDKQALVLINLGDKADDLVQLTRAIQTNVLEETGIRLEVEPQMIGG